MRKEFDSAELARWFSDNYECWSCGKNTWNAFHHIDINGDYSNSILNAAPLCNFTCHINKHSSLRAAEVKKTFFKKTLQFLLEHNYQLKEIDKKFIESHYNIYKDILKETNAIRYQQSSSDGDH